MHQIIVLPRGQLKPADRKRLAEVGACDFVRILAKRTKEREDRSAVAATEKGETR